MLKTRVIPVLLHKNMGLVKGVGFKADRRTGSAIQTIRLYNMRQVDEIILLDVAATPEWRGPDFAAIGEITKDCLTPLTVGGGVRDLDDIRQLLLAGADKVAITTAALKSPHLIHDAAKRFGSQCIVVGIDVRNGEVFGHCGAYGSLEDPAHWASRAEAMGAGEILLNSIDRDGTMQGYDLDLIKAVSGAVSIPVIACGGAGSYKDFDLALKAGAHAVAAGAMFHFTEQTPQGAKRYLADQGFAVRL